MIDETHDPAARSWVGSAQLESTDFPLQNLPFGVFRRHGRDEPWRGGVAIGEEVFDLRAACEAHLFDAASPLAAAAARATAQSNLRELMQMGRPAWRALRRAVFALLRDDSALAGRAAACIVAQPLVEMALPAPVGNYTDFFTSHDHMRRMGQMFQPERPLLPHFTWLPIAYHGRASTVEVGPSMLPRPWGQVRRADGQGAELRPTAALDFELELGAWVGTGNARGTPIALADAEDHLFGVCLLNDWSARDVQGWEAQPLGPFQSKSFLTTVSPWIVTMEALAPFRCEVRRDEGDPPVLPYLQPPPGRRLGIDLHLQAWLCAPGQAPVCVTDTRSTHAHWSFAQMLAHHTLNGCAMQAGDLIGSGTQSGPGPAECGCLMERAAPGGAPVVLPDGARRKLLADGDSLVLRAVATRPGAARIGFGECWGTVLPAAAGPAGLAVNRQGVAS